MSRSLDTLRSPMKLGVTFLSALALLGGAACSTTEAERKPDPIATAPAPVVEKPKTPDDRFGAAVQAFEAGKLDEAEAGFTKVLEAQPDAVNARFNLGVISERRSDLAKAQTHYEAALALDPDHTPSLLNLGKLYRLQGKFDKAISLYEGALKRPGREHDVPVLNNLTVAYRLAKDYAKAEATARRVLSRSKDNPDAYKNLALIYYDQGNYRLAEFISANARKLDEKDPGVYNNLGMIYLKMDDRPRALAQFQKAVELSDAFAPGHMNIGAMALHYRDYQTAEKSFAKAVKLDPNSAEAHLSYAYALDGQKGRDPKKGPQAGAEFEKVLKLRGELPDAVCGAGWAYSVEKTSWEKSITFLEKCKAQPQVAETERQLIDSKLKALAAMIKSGAAQPAAQDQKPKPPKPTSGPSLLDKASEQEAANEAASGTPAPAEGAPAPAPAPTPAPNGK